ncbi:MAG: hypothetical protein ACRCZB_08500, partial [Bacteroidales bacterium]
HKKRNKKGQDFGKGSKKILLGGLKFLISLVPHSFSKNFYASFAAFFVPFPMSEGGRVGQCFPLWSTSPFSIVRQWQCP